ncbi:MAG: 50S ribosomal protein L11 methyltransferase [Cyanobacteria bacterium P01_D01_bin.105]
MPASIETSEKWWEVTVICPLNLEDSIYWTFDELGSKGTASQKKDDSRIVTAYFPQASFQPADFEGLRVKLLDLVATQVDNLAVNMATGPTVDISWHLIDEEDWAKSWKRHWQPEEIGTKLLINPAWLELPETERVVLTLDPGSAFGTGAHATTQLCLEALEKETLEGQVIADIGCGSGILSIVALLYGAKQIYAADVDPLSFTSTQSNAKINGIQDEQLQVEVGSLPEVIAMAQKDNALPVDGIVCNILSEIIVGLIIPRLSEIAGSQTWGVLSGILTSKAPWVEEHLVANGWKVTGMAHKDEWCSMNIQLAGPLSA